MESIPAKRLITSACKLAEGPVWYRNQFWWVDIQSMKLHRWDPETNDVLTHPFPELIGFAIPSTQQKWVIGLKSGIHTWHPATSKLKLLYSPESHLPENRFNDGKCAPDGSVWAGTIGPNKSAALYCSEGMDTCTKKLDMVTISNGLAWDAHGKLMYYIDTPTQNIDVFDYDSMTHSISNRRTVFQVPKEMGSPDGMTIDKHGTLWVALWGGSSVIAINPNTATIVTRVILPTARVTSCTFGGENFNELFITTAQSEGDEHSGHIYHTKLPVSGFPITLARL